MNINIKKKVCDGCQTILIDDNEAVIRKPFISIKGSVCLNNWLNKLDRYSYLYLTQNYTEVHDFCSVECFKNWMNDRRKQAVQALYNAYLEKCEEDKDIELERFGITEDDLIFIGVKT